MLCVNALFFYITVNDIGYFAKICNAWYCFFVETKRHLIANNPSFNATFNYSVSTLLSNIEQNSFIVLSFCTFCKFVCVSILLLLVAFKCK